MQEFTYYCDHCGRKIDAGMANIKLGNFYFARDKRRCDLCTNCYKELHKFMMGFCNYKEN